LYTAKQAEIGGKEELLIDNTKGQRELELQEETLFCSQGKKRKGYHREGARFLASLHVEHSDPRDFGCPRNTEKVVHPEKGESPDEKKKRNVEATGGGTRPVAKEKPIFPTSNIRKKWCAARKKAKKEKGLK